MIICFPIAYPIGKVILFLCSGYITFSECIMCYNVAVLPSVNLIKIHISFMIQILDSVFGHHDALFRRPQLKALVSIHSQEVNVE